MRLKPRRASFTRAEEKTCISLIVPMWWYVVSVLQLAAWVPRNAASHDCTPPATCAPSPPAAHDLRATELTQILVQAHLSK
jgi:hypothetical protein